MEEIRKLRNAFVKSLERELARNPPLTLPQGDVSICNLLVSKCTALRLDPGSWISHLFTFFQRAEHTAPEGGTQLPKELDQVDRVPSVVWRAHQRAQLGQLHRLGKGRRASCPFIFFILQAPFYHLLCIFYNHWDISCLPFRLKNSLNYKQKDLPIDRQPEWPFRCFEDKKVP